MTPDPALDAAIREARHLLFAFDGPIRSADKVKATRFDGRRRSDFGVPLRDPSRVS